MVHKSRKNELGFSLLSTVLVLLACLLLVLGGWWLVGITSVETSTLSGDSEAAFYAAEGGMAETLAYLSANADWPPIDEGEIWPQEVTLNGVAASVEISKESVEEVTHYHVSSSSDFGGTFRELLADTWRSAGSGRNPLDIALILDVSVSMRDSDDCCPNENFPYYVSGGSEGCCSRELSSYDPRYCNRSNTARFLCARDAIVDFINNEIFDYTDDYFGFVEFGSMAEATQPLTPDKDAVISTVEDSEPVPFPIGSTNIGNGLEKTYEMFLQDGREGVSKVAILFTDGQANIAPINPAYRNTSASEQCSSGGTLIDDKYCYNVRYCTIQNTRCYSDSDCPGSQTCTRIIRRCPSEYAPCMPVDNCPDDPITCERTPSRKDCCTVKDSYLINYMWWSTRRYTHCGCEVSSYIIDQADNLKDFGVEIYGVGVGSGVEEETLAELTSSPPEDYYYTSDDINGLAEIFETIAGHINSQFSYTVEEVIPGTGLP